MHEKERGTNGPGPSWHADPLSSTPRLRWWNGAHWSAWVVASVADLAAIAWVPELAELPPPIRWGSPVLRVADLPPLEITLAGVPAPHRDDPPVVATGPGEPRRHAPTRRRRRHLLLGAALIPVLAIAGVASAALLTTGPRPALTGAMAYRDGPAGFSLTYAQTWRIQRVNPGQGIRFVVSAAHASPDKLATVSVTAGTQKGPLPAAADLARTVLDGLRPEFPGIVLATSGSTSLAGGPAVLLTFTDPGTNPATRLEQIVGRTGDGRPLTVTVTIPDPRRAPRDADLHTFFTSITS